MKKISYTILIFFTAAIWGFVGIDQADLVRFSVEGEYPGDNYPIAGEDCEGVPVQFEVYYDGSSTPVILVSGNLLPGSSIPGYITFQWYIDWSTPNLYGGNYRFKIVSLAGYYWNSVLSSNVLTVTGPPVPLVCSVTPNPASGNTPLNDVDVAVAVTSGFSQASKFLVDCDISDGVNYISGPVLTNSSHTFIDVCDYASTGIFTVRGRVEEQGSGA